jgi:cytochrome P450
MSPGDAVLPVLDFSAADIHEGRLTALLVDMATQHGPICRGVLPDGPGQGRELIFMIGPEANRFVLHTARDHFSHDQGWSPYLGERVGKGLLNMDPPEHTVHRKIWQPAFTAACMEAYLPIIDQVLLQRLAAWDDRPVVDVYAEARAITFDVAAAALAGFPLDPSLDRLRALFYTLVHGFDAAQESWETFVQRMQQARTEIAGLLLARIAQSRRRPQGNNVLGLILQAQEAHGLSDEQVLAHLNILLVAGHETTTTLGARVLTTLARYPAYQEQVVAELAAVGALADTPVSLEAVRGLKLLDAVVREVGRLYPPVLMVPRGVVHAYTFAGYAVPAGAQVRLALAASHRLPGLFRAPDQFDPTRFLPPRDEERDHPYALVTFGGGPRLCIGMSFAQLEVKRLVMAVLRRYQVTPDTTQDVPHTGFWTAFASDSLRVRLTPRAASL